jgi:chromate reductase, NAD(P)H dehydrogenase (quinone)
MAAMRILGISGSLRRASFNTSLLRLAAARLPSGVELDLFDGLADVPPYNQDDDTDPVPAGAARLRGAIARADGLLVATPEYNGTLSGALKNAIDWASRPFPNSVLKGKAVAVVGASAGKFGAVWAQADARKSLAVAGADVLDRELSVGEAHKALSPDATLGDPALQVALGEIAAALASRIDARPSRGGNAPPIGSVDQT